MPLRSSILQILAPALLLMLGSCASAQNNAPATLPTGGAQVLAPDALLSTPVGGLERAKATSQIVPAQRQPFARGLRVVIGASTSETNATQLTMLNAAAVEKGDVLLAAFSVRGTAADGKAPAQLEFLFERASDPWTKSVSTGVSALPGNVWKRVLVPFASSEAYAPGQVMASLRFALGPQTIEVGGLSLQNFGKKRSLDELIALAATSTPLGAVRAQVIFRQAKQTMRGFGGNFAQPRYGATEALDAVGRFNLERLAPTHARLGLPLNFWAPERGVYKDEAQAHATFEQMQLMAARRIPITLSVWEGPTWMLPGQSETGRPLPRENYAACVEAIAQFLVTARDKYKVQADYFSFNEPDYGVNFKFTSSEMADFIRLAGPRFQALGLKTRFLVADTANGSNFADYARPLLEDKQIAPFLGPLAFHSWDVMSAPDAKYLQIAALAQQYNKPVWCTEAGHDAQLWRAPNPWAGWDNALQTALAYERTLRLSGAEQMDYWTYQNNYPLLSADGAKPFPVWHVMQQMQSALPPGALVATASAGPSELRILPARGPGAGQFSLLLINPIGAGTATLQGLPPGATLSIEASTSETSLRVSRPQLKVSRAGSVSIFLPARSVVTVLSRAQAMPQVAR